MPLLTPLNSFELQWDRGRGGWGAVAGGLAAAGLMLPLIMLSKVAHRQFAYKNCRRVNKALAKRLPVYCGMGGGRSGGGEGSVEGACHGTNW